MTKTENSGSVPPTGPVSMKYEEAKCNTIKVGNLGSLMSPDAFTAREHHIRTDENFLFFKLRCVSPAHIYAVAVVYFT